MLSGRTYGDRERGATAVLVASTLVLICGILAIAIDAGFGFGERRIDQTAADAAALGGSLELVITDQANALEAALDRVYELVDDNLGRTVPYSDWAACSDNGALFHRTLSDLGASNGSDCVSLSADFNTFRVRVPNQAVDTSFGAVVGVDALQVNAAAEAARNAEFGGGGNVPFYVLSGTSVGAELCIKSGTDPEETCGNPSSGNFGDFEPYYYSAVNGDPATVCHKGLTPGALAYAVAYGIDHEFSRYAPAPPGGTERLNGGSCPIPGPLLPNTIQPGSGYSAQDITKGLVRGGTWSPGSVSHTYVGRLARNDATATAQDTGTASIFTVDIDNRPLWDYIDAGLATANSLLVPSCDWFGVNGKFGHITTGDMVEYNDRYNMLLSCLGEADANSIRILTVDLDGDSTPDILQTPRLGAAPRLWQSTSPTNNNEHMEIEGLSPIFIQSLYTSHPSVSCSGLDVTLPGVCVHRAGLDGSMTANPNTTFDSVGATVLSCALIPDGACPTLQDPSGTGLTFLYDLELTR